MTRIPLAFLLGAAVALAVTLVNFDTVYAWHWNTFVYRGGN